MICSLCGSDLGVVYPYAQRRGADEYFAALNAAQNAATGNGTSTPPLAEPTVRGAVRRLMHWRKA